MSEQKAATPEPKGWRAWRPHYGHAPILAALGLLCIYDLINVALIVQIPDRAYACALLGASIQLLSGAVYVATRRRWSPLFNLRENPAHTPWATYGLVLGPFAIGLVAIPFWLNDARPHTTYLLLLACSIPSIAQACVVFLAERSFRRHALKLLVAPALPPDMPSGARGAVTGTVEFSPQSVALHRLYRVWVENRQSGWGHSAKNSVTHEAAALEGAALPINILTPSGSLFLERAPDHWATDQIVTFRPVFRFVIDVRAEVRVGDPVLVLGNVRRESPGADSWLTGNSSAPLVLFGAPRGSNPRVSLWWLYLRSWLRVLALLAFAGCALAAARWNPMIDRYEGTVRVTSAVGVEGLEAGDTCGITILTYMSRLYERRCQATLVCAGRELYGVGNDGLFDCEITYLESGTPHVKGADLKMTPTDEDAAFSIDSATGSVRHWGATQDNNTLDIQGTLETLEPQEMWPL
jgi:hypothetical protein